MPHTPGRTNGKRPGAMPSPRRDRPNYVEPQTIGTETRTICLGKHNWAIVNDGIESIVEVSEDNIKEAV
ncbi:MAG: hypothetical protein ABL984_04790 [Pyrinomonadaceae bacterium]